MTGAGPTSSREQHPAAPPPGAGPTDASPPTGPDGPAAPPPAVVRAAKLNAANMVRSMLPLVLICLAIVGWVAFRQTPTDPVREVDPASSVQLAAARASYPVLVPTGLPEGYRPTSARTDAGQAVDGGPVTLEIGWFTPEEEFAGYVIGDDLRARALDSVLDGAEEQGTVVIDGQTWTRATTSRGETALTREAGGATLLVTGSASDAELTEVAAAVTPYAG